MFDTFHLFDDDNDDGYVCMCVSVCDVIFKNKKKKREHRVVRAYLPAWCMKTYWALYYGALSGVGAPCVTKSCNYSSLVSPAPGRCRECCASFAGRKAGAIQEWAGRINSTHGPPYYQELMLMSEKKFNEIIVQKQKLIQESASTLATMGFVSSRDALKLFKNRYMMAQIENLRDDRN